MKDTSPEFQEFYEDLLMKRSPEERLKMGCSMFDSAREIVRRSILDKNPDILPEDLKRQIFLRFYSLELDKKLYSF